MKIPILKIPFTGTEAEEIGREVTALLLEGRLAMGRHNEAFEKAFARFCQSPYALGASNGTAALELISRALDLEGFSVAVPANTFMATALAPLAAGGKIILIDCERDSLQMCPKDLAAKIRPDTKAVILVHLGGMISPKLHEIKKIVKNNGSVLIEDAAHAHGAEIYLDSENKEGDTLWQKAGTLGLAAAFSFYPTKVLTTAEGGMVTTADKDLWAKMSAIRQHGQMKPGSNCHELFGLNYRPSEIHALLGLSLLKKAAWILKSRRQCAALYDELLKGGPLQILKAPENQRPAYYKYICFLPDHLERAYFKKLMAEKYEVQLTGEVYATSLHHQPFWTKNPNALAVPLEPLPNCQWAAERQICLPLYPGLSAEEQEYVVSSLMSAIALSS